MSSTTPGWLRVGGGPQEPDPTESHVLASADLQEPAFLLDSALDASAPVTGNELFPGDIFAGLQVEEALGVGGMATVYRAFDPAQGTCVALKVLDRRLVGRDRHLARFRREAGIVSRLRHPRIVTVLAYGEERGHPYLTMPLVQGRTLATVVAEQGPLDPPEAARVVESVSRAIDAAHRQRVVHRDLKPSNVMLDPVDGPLVLDFGLAKDLSREPTLTDTGEILGTPAFLAPEQVAPGNHPQDHRIDVYGLGGLLFFALTGRALHPGETSMEVLRHLLRHDPPRLRDVAPHLPRPLEVICAKALSRDPRDRYQTASDLADDLARYLGQEGILARLPGPLQRLRRQARSQPWLVGTVAALAIALAGAALLVRATVDRLALQQRSQQALSMLALAQEHAAAERHDLAEQAFLQAMLVAKGAYVEAPHDDRLRTALATVKRARMQYAEAVGNWALAHELRQNLASLEGTFVTVDPAPVSATITVHALSRGERVEFIRLDGDPAVAVATATADRVELDLVPGTYLALHFDRQGNRDSSHLVVIDPDSRHILRLDRLSAPPPGVFALPADELVRLLRTQ